MNIQSNNPFPQTPQRWDECRWIYYYNIKDNGPEEEGGRYEAEFVIIESLEQSAIDKAVELASTNPDKARELVDNIEQILWDYPQRKIRVFMADSDYLDMLTEHPDLLSFFDVLKDFIVKRNGGRWIYLEELFDEHRFIFNQYRTIIIEEV